MTAFEEMGVMPELGRAVDDMEWTLPTDIQNEAIPAILGGGDVLLAAETGSGKTGAFCLPVIQIVWETLRDIQTGKLTHKGGSKKPSLKWELNKYDRGEQLAITPDGLLCQARDPRGWHGSRCMKGVINKGAYMFEATVTDDGLCRVGWSTLDASLELGTDYKGFGFGGTGKKSWCKDFDEYGESFTKGDTIGSLLDLDRMEVSWSKNGKRFPVAYRIPKDLHKQKFFPAVVLKNAEMAFNFGAEPFKNPIDGFTGVSQAPLDFVVDTTYTGIGTQTAPIKPAPNAPMCIILEPSRELAIQTYKQIESFKKHLDSPSISNVLAVGGDDVSAQRRQIQSGVDIITGTPGRMAEFINSGELCLSQCRFFVLDEADGLLAQDHGKLIRTIHQQVPKLTPDGRRLQMVVCSATLHNFDVKRLANELLHFPQWIDLKGADVVPDTVHHVVVTVDPNNDRKWIRLENHIATDGVHVRDRMHPGSSEPETLSNAIKILKGEYVVRAIRQQKMQKEQAIIFCRTKLDCDNLENYLKQTDREFTCVCLHSDRAPRERTQNLDLFKKGKVRFLICTDVAARGIDIKGIPFVINVTLPDDKANYLHRIGRVGRAERMGLAISLCASTQEKVWYHGCPSRGKNCNNTKLTSQGGCTIWYNEPQLLAEIEEHLGVTIPQCDTDINVPVDEFDGKVIYGAKRAINQSGTYKGHAKALSGALQELAALEKKTMTSYLNMKKQFAV